MPPFRKFLIFLLSGWSLRAGDRAFVSMAVFLGHWHFVRPSGSDWPINRARDRVNHARFEIKQGIVWNRNCIHSLTVFTPALVNACSGSGDLKRGRSIPALAADPPTPIGVLAGYAPSQAGRLNSPFPFQTIPKSGLVD